MNDSPAKTTLTREALYDLVWKKPIRHLAKEFGISDVGLAKVCKRHNIPKPPVGYWVKKANGKIVRKLSLPPSDDPKLATITIDPVVQSRRDDARDNPRPLASTFFDSEIGKLAEREAKEFEPIRVADLLRSPHPLVKRTQEGLIAASKQRTYWNNLVLWPSRADHQCCLDVHVGEPMINRAMRIMDALIKGLEARGYKISVPTTQWSRGMLVDGLGVKLQFRLREPTVRQKHEPTPEERKHLEKYPGSSSVKEFDYVLSDKLQLELMHSGHWSLKSWKDGKKLRIEDSLAEVPLAMLRLVDHWRHQAAIRAEEARQQEEIARQRREEEEKRRLEEQRLKEEQDRMQALFAEAETWGRCQQLRAYIEARRSAASEGSEFIESGSELARHLAWAKQVADKFDPMKCDRKPEEINTSPLIGGVAPRKPR